MITIYCKLIAEHQDLLGYTNYVFESLDETQENFLYSKYIMTTKFPNWENDVIDMEDVGFLTFKEVIPGVNKWYDGEKFVDYNSFEGFQFIKFIKKNPSKKDVYKL